MEQIVEDPALIAARQERERAQAEERKVMERNELYDRRRVEALEQVAWKAVYHEKEKKLDAAAWAAKVAPKGPVFLWIKPLVGNRGMQHQALRVPVQSLSETSVLLLKNAIRDEAVRTLGALPLQFAPEKQKLYYLTKELHVPDELNVTLASLGIQSGATLHVSLDMPNSVRDLLPSQVTKGDVILPKSTAAPATNVPPAKSGK